MSISVRWALCLVSVGLVGLTSGCNREPEPQAFIARVDEVVLTHDDVLAALISMPAGLDSLHAAEQFIERWVTDELLAQEARRRRMETDPEVQRRLAENERSVLITSLIDRLYEEVELPSESEIGSFFDRNVGSLAIREPFLHIRYAEIADSVSATETAALLDTLHQSSDSDSTWLAMVPRIALQPETASALSSNYYPASRLFRNVPHLLAAVDDLEIGEATVIPSADSTYHVIQLADRVEAGTEPQLEWIIEEVSNRLLIEKRKQMYIDQVQRLRNRALAEGILEIRN